MKLAKVFADGCVLQRNQPIAIFGTEESGHEITVTLNGSSVKTTAADGKWKVMLPSMSETTGISLCCENDMGEEITLTDIAVGEVWLATGQSNMEFLLCCDADRAEVLDSVNEPNIRFYEVPKISYEGQLENEDHSSEGIWRKAVPGDVGFHSAVGFYFARRLRQNLGDIPVGIIGCNWGGSSAACWLDESYLTDELDYYMELNRVAAASDSLEADFEIFKEQGKVSHSPKMVEGMMKFMSTELTGPMNFPMDEERMAYFKRTKYAPFSQFRSAGIYHTMLETVMPYSVAGAIWYQGEEDASKSEMYLHLYAQMVRCWRDKWGWNMPVIQAQLASYDPGPDRGDLDFVNIRAVQEQITKAIPGVYFVCTMDVGSHYDIHPKKKRPVGERMALQALNHVYGFSVESECPEVVSAKKEGGKLTLEFLHTAGGLVLAGEQVEGLSLKVNGLTVEPVVSVAGNAMVIAASEIREDSRVEVDYAQVRFVIPNVYTRGNLPVRPFKVLL